MVLFNGVIVLDNADCREDYKSVCLSPVGFSHLDVMLVECYDPKGDQWNILQTPILEGRSGPGCAVLDDSIYLVGGYSWSMVNKRNI